MRSDVGAYVRDVVSVREPAPDLARIRERSLPFHARSASNAPVENVTPALIAIAVLAFVFVGQIATPARQTTSVRTPAPAPARTA